MENSTKNVAAIVGMAVISILAMNQFRDLMATESALDSSSAVLLLMTVLSGLIALATAGFTVNLVVKTARA